MVIKDESYLVMLLYRFLLVLVSEPIRVLSFLLVSKVCPSC